MHPRIKNWMVDEQPSVAKLERADYFINADYKKPIQPEFSSDSRRKNRTKKSTACASASGQSLILFADNSIGYPNVSNDDDDFVDPLPRCQETSPWGKSRLMKHHRLPITIQMNHTLMVRNEVM
ncbi:Hypothetical predicted protein [Olea europaea subsp. europaea]|uniref:Uncharacterized protein n=1 Tax=Olea europaea subsp. europaea TaxID=158383 RepID=A0A8S0R1Q4_OLEEU|nr:Hypothetical predicted protein [Olea europaea subsp. europaea]